MILLDTNAVSEVLKTRPAEAVVALLNGQDSNRLYVSAITIGEIACGLHILPDGNRRSGLRERFDRFVTLAFDQRVLDYDESAARIYSERMGDRKELRRPVRAPDGQIAATARRNHPAMATWNVVDFESCGIDAANPFASAL